MPTTDLTVQDLLGYVPLTEPVNKIITDLPKVLPDAFYNNRKQVLGDRFRRVAMRGTRKVAQIAPYGSPPRQVLRTGIGVDEVVMLHSIEEISAGPEVLKAFHAYDDYGTPILNAANELARQGEDFAKRQANLRITAIHVAVANGKIWFDSDGNILPTSSGADLTIDYNVPAGNRTTASVSWATNTTDIVQDVLNSQMLSLHVCGRPLKYAIYGKNVAGYLAKNSTFQAYLARYGGPNADFRQAYIKSGVIPDGVLDLTWVKAQDSFYENAAGTITEIFPADQIVYVPEPADVYCVRDGSMMVPKEFGVVGQGADMAAILKQMASNPVYGPFRYGYGIAYPTPQIKTVQGDTFIPDFMSPNSFFYFDTTP